jgi:hypothetical protein
MERANRYEFSRLLCNDTPMEAARKILHSTYNEECTQKA